MKRFMAMLNRNKTKDPPPAKLLDLAGQLCRDLQSSFPILEKLVGAMMGCKHKMYFLTNIHVVRACVFVHIQEKEELVQLWHEIHYRRVMEKHHSDFLTPLQKFRCRKRNPPPVSLCPEGLKNRNYSDEVRQQLHRFATEVTTNPTKKQREGLARDVNLQPTQVYNWFANYRRRQKSCLPRTEKLNNSYPERGLTCHTKVHQDKGSYTLQTTDEQLAMWQAPSSTRGVCGSMWTPSIEVGTFGLGLYCHLCPGQFLGMIEGFDMKMNRESEIAQERRMNGGGVSRSTILIHFQSPDLDGLKLPGQLCRPSGVLRQPDSSSSRRVPSEAA
ncbi:PREDICTED: anomalous homeobox protein, partial [Tauraco erythrolophus]|uniref:anomalous homeobox protein n=1 Tax=Tauraco erythrolophus TaxID=121530 RepID=UPI0005231B89